jgi:hypothetical protein
MSLRISPWLILLLMVGACYERPDALEEALQTQLTLALGGRVLYLRASPDEATLVDMTGPKPTRSTLENGCDVGPTLTFGEAWLALVCWGDAPELRLLAPEPGKAAAWRTYELPSAYTSLAASPDGRFVVAYFGPGPSSGNLFQNTGEFAVIDTTADPSAQNPARKVIDLGDRDPDSLIVSPHFIHGSLEAMLAVVISSSQLAVFNLLDLADSADLVRLVPSGTLTQVTPRQLRFLELPDGAMSLFLSANGAQDVFEVRFEVDVASLGEDAPDFSSTTQLLTVGATPSDFAPFIDAEGGLRVLAINATTQDLAMYFPESGVQRVFRMPYAYSHLSQVERSDGEVHFLLYRPGGSSQPYSRMPADFDVAEADLKSADTFSLIELGGAIDALLPVAGSSRYVVRHADQSLTLLDGETGARKLIRELGSPIDALLVGTRYHLLTYAGDETIYGVLDVESEAAITVAVPGDVSTLLSASVGAPTLLTNEWSTGGALFAVDPTASKPSVTSWLGFLLDGEL